MIISIRKRSGMLLWIVLISAMLGLQSASAVGPCPPYCSSGSGSSAAGTSSTGAVIMMAVGAIAIVSSVDCASRFPSFGVCQPGGSLHGGSMTHAEWGSMGSLIDLHDVLVGQ